MYLRKLKTDDAILMLEWMHDKSVVCNLRTDFSSKCLVDAERFIKDSWNTEKHDKHFAIASDTDEYMGTVSLKEIQNGTAEFAITVRKAAMGHGYAWFGMEEILNLAFKKYNLDCVYWCVSENNMRAVRFYDKHHFHRIADVPESFKKKYKSQTKLIWYSVLKGDLINKQEIVAGCKIIHINTIPTINAGELSFFEVPKDIPFMIKRVYYISKVPEGARRGFHAHINLKQILFCPYGRIQLILENENGREEIELSDPSIGIIIDQFTWREMIWLQKDSVLCVAASDCYDATDYIRDYNQFKIMLDMKKKGGE